MHRQTLISDKINQLEDTQKWFAGIITQPLGKGATIQNYAPSGFLIAEEAIRYITAGPTLRPHQRIQIYNQQYWWRLLNNLHTNFPLVTRLFGYQAFNEAIGVPYLLDCPPKHWSLIALGEQLPQWILQRYHQKDQMLVHYGATLDCAFTNSFIAPSLVSPDFATLVEAGHAENLLQTKLFLQPYIHLFTWEYDLMAFRDVFLKQSVEYWMEHRFPDLCKQKTYRFVLYRNPQHYIAWREISEGEFILLQLLQKGTTLQNACDYIETERSDLCEETANSLQNWIQNWAHAHWLTRSHDN